MSNLASRALTAVVALPLLVALILWEERLGFGALVVAAAAVGMAELTAILIPSAPKLARAVLVAAGASLTFLVYLFPDRTLVWMLGAVVVSATTVLVAPGPIPAAGARLGIASFALPYVGLLCAALALLHREVTDGPNWVFVTLAATFSNDTGAYFAGRALGRHKLYPAVSPAKTIEGAVGGLVASVAALFVCRATFFPALSVGDCLLVAIPAAVLGPIGDLVESLIKRSGGVKDSGQLFPGHGGLLDRVDALMFVAAWVYVYVRFLR